MIADAMTDTLPPVLWLPRATQAPRNQFGRADGVPALIKRLADERFDGSVNALSNPHLLTLLFCGGQVVAARLHSGRDYPHLDGDTAIQGWTERTDADAGMRSQITPLDHTICECITAALDPSPDITPLASIDQLREALRHLATVGHDGIVDVTAADSWGRVLFSQGKIIGVYQSEQPGVVASLAGIAPIATLEGATITVGTVQRARAPRPSPTHIAAIVEPALPGAAPTASAPARTALPAASEAPDEDPGNLEDERIESDLLWLLSDVDRDRERASRSSASDAQLLQVLAGFANSTFGMAAQVAGASEATNLTQALRTLTIQHPSLSELPMKNGRIDASSLAKRCKGFGNEFADAALRQDFFATTSRGLLAVARHGINQVTDQLASRAVSLRCATALEACMISIELELPSRRFRLTE